MYGFLDFFLGIHNGLPHFKSHHFRELFHSGSYLFSNSFDECSSILKGSFSLDFKGGVRPIKFCFKFFPRKEFVGIFDLSCERVL